MREEYETPERTPSLHELSLERLEIASKLPPPQKEGRVCRERRAQLTDFKHKVKYEAASVLRKQKAKRQDRRESFGDDVD